MTSAEKIVAFRPAVRRRVHEDIAEQLRDAILDGRFPAGNKLPPERELAIESMVNRILSATPSRCWKDSIWCMCGRATSHGAAAR